MTKLKIMSLSWVLMRVAEVLLAALLLFLLTSHLEQRESDRFDSIPVTDWFEVAEIFVPNHEVGDDPLIVYDRSINADFTAFWVVEVQRRDNQIERERFFASCSGSGTNIYEQDDYLDPERVTWTWFIGRDCVVPPGIYRLVTTWDMRVPQFDRVKRYKVLSNVFTVYPTGRMPVVSR